ncbi:MAG TPA: hypothetical protein P5234_03830 [Thermoanaerobaculaceae bacterium]|nr:hypothetical protein [Thermoanaerobaculaceae bacterium]HRS15360.1 hypothetical protein [Thermoanaerobaculaceae bacterium]
MLPAGGGFVVTAAAVVHKESYPATNPALDRRLAEARADYAAGWASWSPRFEELDPAQERLELQRVSGEVSRVVRQALARDPQGLAGFFSFTDVQCQLEQQPGWSELSLFTRGSSRASAAERRRMERALADWSAVLSRYLAAVGDLYRYLELHPDRAEPCLGELLGVSDRDKGWEFDAAEKALLEAASGAMQEAVKVLQVPSGEAYSLDELSRRVFDPFPAATTVSLPAEPGEIEGFVARPDGTFEVPALSMWEAMARLEGEWLAPDPLVAVVRHSLCETCEGEFPLGAFLGLPRSAAAVMPSARDLNAALGRQLQPAPAYRLRWPSREWPQGDTFDWRTVDCP